MDENLRLKELKEYRNSLANHKFSTEKEYQKSIITISGGALIVSCTFSDSIAYLDNILFDIVLITGWGLLLLTVILQLVYYRKVVNSSKEIIEKVDESLEKGCDSPEIYNIYTVRMWQLDLLNRFSVFTMSAGLILIIFFFSQSIISKSTNRVKENMINESIKTFDKSPNISIENNPIFILNTKSDTMSVKCGKAKSKPKLNPCP